MTGASNIESIFALINDIGRRLVSEASRSAARSSNQRIVHLRQGAIHRLPARQRWQVVSGRLWLTHWGDDRDHFPAAGDVVDAGDDSVVEALQETVLRVSH
jgi:hypothetical protein